MRLRYSFDNTLAHGPIALIGWLGVVVLVGAVVASLIAYFLLGGSANGGFLDEFWTDVIRFIGPLEIGATWPTRLFLLVVGIGGVVIGGTLIALIAAGISQRVDMLTQGRSRVLESRHTLILGWSPRLPTIIEQLLIANENLTRPAIVILSSRPIAEMEAEIRVEAGDTKNTRIVCRSGNTARPADLELANIAEARSVIVLAGEEGDAGVVKALLAVKLLDPDHRGTRVVAEFTNSETARSIRNLSNGAVNTVNSDDVVAEVTAQACHQPGLSTVFRELLDFSGDECYFAEVAELAGHTYAEVLLAFRTSSVIGRYTAAGVVELNPPPGTVFDRGDSVIAVSEDDDTVKFTGFQDVAVPEPASPVARVADPVKLLIVGWSAFGPRVVDELQEFLPPDSQIEVWVDPTLVSADDIRQARPELTVSYVTGGPENLQVLARDHDVDQVIVLGYSGLLTPTDADSRTLLDLLVLRQVWPVDRIPRVRMIAQLLDQANVELASITGVDDFIVSDALTSLMMAQLSERAELQAVFDDLFDPEGAVVQLRSAHRFAPDAPVAYEQVVAAGTAKSASVFGWRVGATGEVVINPPKGTSVHLRAADQVLLIGARGL